MMSTEVPLQTSAFSDDFVDVPVVNERVSHVLAERVDFVKRAALAE